MSAYGNVRHGAWIGASDEENEGIWKWVTGKKVEKFYWFPGYNEPNGKRNENCLIRGEVNSVNWNDQRCVINKAAYLCQKGKTS